MAEPFKNLLGPALVERLADGLRKAWPAFPRARFVRDATGGLEALELKARARHVADALERALPADPAQAMAVLVRSLHAPLSETKGFGFLYFPYSEYLERHGAAAFDAALEANYELTRRFTSEFCLRTLLIADAERTLAALHAWCADPDPHVRRLCSEGTRPRLPWGRHLPAFQRDPKPVLALLEKLKDDPAEYVRRSVANNLNDIAKDNPAAVLAVAKRWLRGASPERRKLVEHGLRTLVKKGDPAALALLGAGGEELRVKASVTPARVRLGESVTIEARVENRARATAHVVVDARVHFVKAKGPSVKVFRLGRVDLDGGETRAIARRFPLVHRTIRTLHAGRHAVEVQVNGRIVKAGAFDLSLDVAPGRAARGPRRTRTFSR
ncbi:MAG: DNA alkylation repair protein [Vicinamibacteria bacterium]|nr:DNA alkylation repair protein [Vicinamibacteria bacterium]